MKSWKKPILVSLALLARPNGLLADAVTVTCTSQAGERQLCAADTSAGVALQKSGTGECLLGKTWGYDDAVIWVSDGCSAEFVLGQTAPAATAAPAPPSSAPQDQPIETWGEFDPGAGFLVGRSGVGELSISGYAMVRYMNQNPGEQSFTDHLGNVRSVDGRNDIYSHRIMVFLKGWLGTRKLVYAITLWTVNTTDHGGVVLAEDADGARHHWILADAARETHRPAKGRTLLKLSRSSMGGSSSRGSTRGSAPPRWPRCRRDSKRGREGSRAR